jgi:hypothetical protein
MIGEDFNDLGMVGEVKIRASGDDGNFRAGFFCGSDARAGFNPERACFITGSNRARRIYCHWDDDNRPPAQIGVLLLLNAGEKTVHIGKEDAIHGGTISQLPHVQAGDVSLDAL